MNNHTINQSNGLVCKLQLLQYDIFANNSFITKMLELLQCDIFASNYLTNKLLEGEAVNTSDFGLPTSSNSVIYNTKICKYLKY